MNLFVSIGSAMCPDIRTAAVVRVRGRVRVRARASCTAAILAPAPLGHAESAATTPCG